MHKSRAYSRIICLFPVRSFTWFCRLLIFYS